MPPRNLQRGNLPFGEIVGVLCLPDAGCRLERHTENDRIAVGDAAVDAARTVSRTAAVMCTDRVIVLRASHPGGSESVTEFNASHSRYGKYGMGNQRLDRSEKRLAQSDRQMSDRALHDAAQ